MSGAYSQSPQKVLQTIKKQLKELPADNDLVEYLSEAFEVAADNCLPDLVSTIQKNIRKAQTSMNCGNGPRLSLVEDIKPQLSAVVQANASRISKTNGKFQAVSHQEEDAKASKMQQARGSLNPLKIKSVKDSMVKEEAKAQANNNLNQVDSGDSFEDSENSEGSEANHLRMDKRLIDQKIIERRINAGIKSFLQRDVKALELQRISQINTDQLLAVQVRPHFIKLLKSFCEELEFIYPYMPTVLYQLQSKKQGKQMSNRGGSPTRVPRSREASPTKLPGTKESCNDHFTPQIIIQPISARLVTKMNKEIHEQNEQLLAKNQTLINQMNEMRRNYHKDLNNQDQFDMQAKRKMQLNLSRNDNRLLQMSDELIDSIENNTHFFEATDTIPKDLKELLNMKIMKIKNAFEKQLQSQFTYLESLTKKVYLYESMSAEFHGLIEMPIQDIFRGIKIMDHPPEFLWTHITKQFGTEFFLPTIGKLYGHLFVNDIEKHQNEVLNAISGAKQTQKALMQSMAEQVNEQQEQLKVADQEVFRIKQRIVVEQDKSRKLGIIEGQELIQYQFDREKESNQKKIDELQSRNQELESLTKDTRKAIEDEQKKTVLTKLMFCAYQKTANTQKLGIKETIKDYLSKDQEISPMPSAISNQKILDFMQEKTKNQHVVGFEDYKEKMKAYEEERIDMMLENNHMKLRWKQYTEEIESLREELDLVSGDSKIMSSKYENLVREQVGNDQSVEHLERSLIEQGELLLAVTGERDRLYKQVGRPPEKATQVDYMLKATKCIINFNGWQDLRKLKSISYGLKDKSETTEIKGLDKDIQIFNPKKGHSRTVSMEQLKEIRKLPMVDSEVQTDELQLKYINELLKKIGKGKVCSDKNNCVTEKRDEVGKDGTGSQCSILDNEQVMCFIFDKLCSDQDMNKLVNMKRIYSIEPSEQGLGGIKINDKSSKLPEAQRKEMKSQIGELREEFGVKKALPKKWPRLQGAHQRLYDDAGFKEERMAQLKGKIDSMISEQLLKSLQLKNNDMQVFKNQIIMNGFMEQVRMFIHRNIFIDNTNQSHSLFDPQAIQAQNAAASSFAQTLPQNLQMQQNESPESPKKNQIRNYQNPDSIIKVCRFYRDKLKLIIKSNTSTRNQNTLQQQITASQSPNKTTHVTTQQIPIDMMKRSNSMEEHENALGFNMFQMGGHINNRNEKNRSMLSLRQEDIENNNVKINTARMLELSNQDSIQQDNQITILQARTATNKHPYESLDGELPKDQSRQEQQIHQQLSSSKSHEQQQMPIDQNREFHINSANPALTIDRYLSSKQIDTVKTRTQKITTKRQSSGEMVSNQGGRADQKRDKSDTRDSLLDIQVLPSKYQHDSNKNELSPFIRANELKQAQCINSDEEIRHYVDSELAQKQDLDTKGRNQTQRQIDIASNELGEQKKQGDEHNEKLETETAQTADNQSRAPDTQESYFNNTRYTDNYQIRQTAYQNQDNQPLQPSIYIQHQAAQQFNTDLNQRTVRPASRCQTTQQTKHPSRRIKSSIRKPKMKSDKQGSLNQELRIISIPNQQLASSTNVFGHDPLSSYAINGIAAKQGRQSAQIGQASRTEQEFHSAGGQVKQRRIKSSQSQQALGLAQAALMNKPQTAVSRAPMAQRRQHTEESMNKKDIEGASVWNGLAKNTTNQNSENRYQNTNKEQGRQNQSMTSISNKSIFIQERLLAAGGPNMQSLNHLLPENQQLLNEINRARIQEVQENASKQALLVPKGQLNTRKIATAQGQRREIRNSKGAMQIQTNKPMSKVQGSAGGGMKSSQAPNMSHSGGFQSTYQSTQNVDFNSQQLHSFTKLRPKLTSQKQKMNLINQRGTIKDSFDSYQLLKAQLVMQGQNPPEVGQIDREQSEVRNAYENELYGLKDPNQKVALPWNLGPKQNTKSMGTLISSDYQQACHSNAYSRTTLSREASMKNLKRNGEHNSYKASYVQVEPLLIEESKGSLNVGPIQMTQSDSYYNPLQPGHQRLQASQSATVLGQDKPNYPPNLAASHNSLIHQRKAIRQNGSQNATQKTQISSLNGIGQEDGEVNLYQNQIRVVGVKSRIQQPKK